MADSKDVQRTSYPLVAYNFRVEVAGTLMSFTEVSGISAERDFVTYRHGLTYKEGELIRTFSLDKFARVSCKRGTVLGAKPLFLHEWLDKGDLRAMQVSLCDESGAAVLAWKIAYAVPVSVKAPTFSASTNEAAVESVDLQVRGVSFVEI